MDNLGHAEKKVIEELRRRTINDMTLKTLEDVSIFYRFSKARDFNLVEAEALLRKHISWRNEFQIDTIVTDYEPPEVLVKYLASSFVCFDKEGGCVRLQDWGRADTKGLTCCLSKEEMMKYVFYLAEKDKVSFLKKGGNFSKPFYFALYDLDELTYANAMNMKSLQLLIYGLKMLLDNYPEIVKNITIINAPFYFPWAYAFVKPILPPTVTEKMHVYSKCWKEALLKAIDADDLPAYLGGNKMDPDGNPFCETIIQRGKPIPKRYIKQSGDKTLFLASGAEKLTVLPFCKEEITFEIKDEISFIEWEIEIENRDINFSLKYRGYSSEYIEPEELIPKQRINSTSESAKGCFKCEKIGVYTILFDNSYSWLHSADVYYKVRIRNIKNNELPEAN